MSIVLNFSQNKACLSFAGLLLAVRFVLVLCDYWEELTVPPNPTGLSDYTLYVYFRSPSIRHDLG